jgi:hypothetical protein
MAKARMPKVKDLGNGELKNAYTPWDVHGFCVYARNYKNDLHMLFVILNNKKKLDAIVYERKFTVSLETKVDLRIDKITDYLLTSHRDKTAAVFVLSSEGCDTNRNFAYTPNGYGMVLPNGFFDNMEDSNLSSLRFYNT